MAGKGVGKSIVLIIIIVILVLGGLLWFDWLGLINVGFVRKGVSKILKKDVQTTDVSTLNKPVTENIDENRLAKQREALEILIEEQDKRESDLSEREKQSEQIAAELMERERNLEEREKTFEQTVTRYDEKTSNISQIGEYLNGMRPEHAVSILNEMEIQNVIDVLRKVEETAKAEEKTSMVSYWLSLMPPDRAAEIKRKMITKPENLD